MISWKNIKEKLMKELKKVDNEDKLEDFIISIVGGFIHSNKDELLRELNAENTENIQIKHENPVRDYLGYLG